MWSLNDHWLVPLATWLWDLNKWDISTLLYSTVVEVLGLASWSLHKRMNHISLEKGKPGCVQIYPLCRTRFGQYQVTLGMLACDSSCVWGACMLLSFYCHVVYVASHELYWAALNFSPSSQTYHEMFVMDNFCVLVSRFPLSALLLGTRTTLLWVVKLKRNYILCGELFLAFTKCHPPLIL